MRTNELENKVLGFLLDYSKYLYKDNIENNYRRDLRTVNDCTIFEDVPNIKGTKRTEFGVYVKNNHTIRIECKYQKSENKSSRIQYNSILENVKNLFPIPEKELIFVIEGMRMDYVNDLRNEFKTRKNIKFLSFDEFRKYFKEIMGD